LVFGSTLGIWQALNFHFLIRDNLIRHFNKIQNWKNAKNQIDESE